MGILIAERKFVGKNKVNSKLPLLDMKPYNSARGASNKHTFSNLPKNETGDLFFAFTSSFPITQIAALHVTLHSFS